MLGSGPLVLEEQRNPEGLLCGTVPCGSGLDSIHIMGDGDMFLSFMSPPSASQ